VNELLKSISRNVFIQRKLGKQKSTKYDKINENELLIDRIYNQNLEMAHKDNTSRRFASGEKLRIDYVTRRQRTFTLD
jgi:hypothetical protein